MKCQKCDRPATFHITELTGSTPVEVHLCEEHTREYLNETAHDDSSPVAGMAAALAQQLSQQIVSHTAEQLSRLDDATCPVCGIAFRDFRNQGRLGCPNDYAVFREQLQVLLESIHGAIRYPGTISAQKLERSRNCMQLIRLRRDLEDAIHTEEYEHASKLRDQIRKVEALYLS